ncbi:MAG: hypothetical protein IJX56_03405 [Alistipes sp.]|nr:hypothetical protein [Alistipes sp.]
MKKYKYIFYLIIFIPCSLFSQISFTGYRNGRLISVDNTNYVASNILDNYLSEKSVQEKGVTISLNSNTNTRIKKIGQYKDGSYVEFPEEVSGIIVAKTSYDDIIYTSVREAFTKEELSAHPDWHIWIFVAVDDTGNIIESAASFHIQKDYVIQPEQIHTLMLNIRNRLRFTLNKAKASPFNWFEGQILIRLGNYIEDRDLLPGLPINHPTGGSFGNGSFPSLIP